MPDIKMPAGFPEEEFREFGTDALAFFVDIGSCEGINDFRMQNRVHFVRSWQAVRHRYLSCAESNDEFKAQFANLSDMWKAGWGDEELMYKFERSIYFFFVALLSIFESFAFSLYFFGNALKPECFPIGNLMSITVNATKTAFSKNFSDAAITESLNELCKHERYQAINRVRNVLAHRISGRLSVTVLSTRELKGTCTSERNDTWAIPGADVTLDFGDTMLQEYLSEATTLLKDLSLAARDFAQEKRQEFAEANESRRRLNY